jgi:hypothetical protein
MWRLRRGEGRVGGGRRVWWWA